MENVIRGAYSKEADDFGVVEMDGAVLTPRESLKIVNHSPTGFSWGYNGSGPAQLALAILLKAGVPHREAVEVYQQFKNEFIARQPIDGDFELRVDVQDWAKRHARLFAADGIALTQTDYGALVYASDLGLLAAAWPAEMKVNGKAYRFVDFTKRDGEVLSASYAAPDGTVLEVAND